MSGGQGRNGTWYAPYGTLALTFCLNVSKDTPSVLHYPQLLLLCTCQLLKNVSLKWPNDLILDGKKLGGIVTEVNEHDERYYLYIGIGINVNLTADDLAKIDQPAISLFTWDGNKRDIQALTQELSGNFANAIQTYTKKGFKPFLEKYKNLFLHKKGDLISFKKPKIEDQMRFVTISDNGSLIVELPDKSLKTISDGIIV